MEEKLFNTIIYWSVRVLTFFNLASWQEIIDQDNLDARARAMIESAQGLGIKVKRLVLFNKETELFKAGKDSKEVVFKHLPLAGSYAKTRQIWVDDKWQAKKIMKKNNLPVVSGKLALTLGQLLKAGDRMKYPLVIKPRASSLSKGVYLDNLSSQDLKDNYPKTKKYGQQVLIEPQVKGKDYRITLIGGEVKGVALREPANVTGNGKLTIKELILEKNKHSMRDRQRNTTHYPIKISNLPNNYLNKRGIDLKEVLEKNKKVYLHYKVNLGSGADIIDQTDQIHPDNIAMFKKIPKIFDSQVIGIDYVSSDISIPYYKNQSKIIELNSLPYLNMHHWPWQGKPRPVAEALWQQVFKQKD